MRIFFIKIAVQTALLISLIASMSIPASAQEGETSSGMPSSDEPPIAINADRLEYLKDEDRYRAAGSVRITKGDLSLTADRVMLDNQTGRALAEGRVILHDGEDTLTSDTLEFSFREKNGIAVPGRLFIERENLYLRAGRMAKSSDVRYELDDWQITACDTEEGKSPLWQLRGRKARAELGGYLVARDVFFYIKRMPVFYTPFLFWPIKTERQTGFLIPRVGASTRDGLRYNQEFFWAISPSQDATFGLDYRSRRGIGGELEYRYKLSRNSEGELEAKLFDDKTTDQVRTEFQYRHVQRFTQNLQSKLDVHLVNDIDRFRELEDATADRVQQSLTSSFVVFQRWESQEIYLQARYTRDLLADEDTVLQVLPELGYRLHEYKLGPLPLYAGLEATAVHFWRETEDLAAGLVRAKRLDAFPRLTGRIHLAGLVITPRAGYRATWYSRQLNSNEAESRGVGVYGVGVNSRLVRSFSVGDGRMLLHHVQPALDYAYVPFVEQSTLPHFDDIDQLPRKNDLTYSLTNRFVLSHTAERVRTPRREFLYLKVTQSYDLHAKRTRKDPGSSRPFSNIRTEAILRPLRNVALDLDGFYNLYRDETVSFNSDLVFEAGTYLRLAAGQRYTRTGAVFPRGDVFNPLNGIEEDFWFNQASSLIRFWTAGGRVTLPGRWAIDSRIYYDAEAKKLAEAFYGLQFMGQCWGFEAGYRDLPDRNHFSFMITLRPERSEKP